MTTWEDLEKKLCEIRASIDAADDTGLGKLGALLDKMAKDTDIAMAMAGNLRYVGEEARS